MSKDQNEPLDFGQLGMFDNLPGAEPAGEAAPDAAVAPVAEEKEEEEKEKKPGLWEKISTASPYTVMLAVSLLAIVIAAVLLGLELSQYGWDIKAKAFTGG